MLIGPDGTKVNPDLADRSNPFSVDDGAGWRSGRDSAEPDVLPEARGKPSIRMGQWNEL